MQRSALHNSNPKLCMRAAANVTIMGVRYPLFTHVHHHYGLNDAFDRSVSALLSLAPLEGSGSGAGSGSAHGTANDSAALAHVARTQQARPATAHWHADHRGATAALQAEREADHGQGGAGGGRAPPDGQDPAGSDALAALAAAAAAEQRRAEAGHQAGGAGSVVGRRRLQHAAAAGDRRPARRRMQEETGAAARDSAGTVMAEGAGEPEEALGEVAHPCLHAGYVQPYTRMALEGLAPAPEPPRVRLIGR